MKEQLKRESLLGRVTATRQKVTDSEIGSVWSRLNALDFLTQAMSLAALLLLTTFPFFIAFNALAGRNFSLSLSRRLGLSPAAAKDLEGLFASASRTSQGETVVGLAFLVIGMFGAAATIQALYLRVFALERRGIKDIGNQAIWLLSLAVLGIAGGYAGRTIRNLWSGPVFLGVISFIVLTGFFWWTLFFLLGRRIPAKNLMAPAVFTAAFWIGLTVFSSLYFSSEMVSNSRDYGDIGVIFVLLSWLIAVGVVLVLGAIAGEVWHEENVTWRLERFGRFLWKPVRHHGDAGAADGEAGAADGDLPLTVAEKRGLSTTERWFGGRGRGSITEGSSRHPDQMPQ